MCGIVGIVHENAQQKKCELKKMLKAIAHRGPDKESTSSFQYCILGHQRLTIIDSTTGSQPMHDLERQNAIVFNGEIYGYQTLKEKIPYPYYTQSDTEVILAAYRQYGEKCLEYLPGMFAFAIWNEKEQKLFCARDRFGEKPFFYAIGANQEFIFASEIKAITESQLIKPILDTSALYHYTQKLYISPYQTVYKNIFTLPPAHTLSYQNGIYKIKRYWNPPRINRTISLSEAGEHFDYLLNQSVQKLLIADVPVGVFLSGGLDSSTIVALTSRYQKQVETFSFGFGNSINELPYAETIAKKYKTNHQVLQAQDFNLVDLLLQMQSIYDEPFADSSNIPTYLISKEAAKKMKVILTGDGADELLAGYDFWYNEIFQECKKTSKNLFKNLLSIRKNWVKKHENQNMFFSTDELSKLFKKPIVPPLQKYKNYENSMNGVLLMDIEDYMAGDILVKTDRASMANSLELRAPFLEIELAEFLISLPYQYKINELQGKTLLRQTFQHLWTDEIRTRPKQGFGAPINQWLQSEDFRVLIELFLLDKNKKIFDLVEYQIVKDKYAKYYNYQCWILLNLSIWLETRHISYE